VKCLLIYPFPESSLNEEAGKLFMENYQEYYKIARLYTNIHSVDSSKGSRSNGEFFLMETVKEKVILTNDSIISNENNILIQKNTNEIMNEKSLGKKTVKPLPISENEMISMSENSHKSHSDKKESKTNLRTFELLRTNSTSLQSTFSAIQYSNNTTVDNNYSLDSKKCKKDDMKKWISRI
jgi:hypothetical protein